MSTFLAIYTEQFRQVIGALKTKTVGNIVGVFEQVGGDMIKALQTESSKSGGKSTKTRKSSSPRALTWNQIWAKKEIGGKDFFSERYGEIKEETGEKNHFALLKRLRDWAEVTQHEGCDHTEWERWWHHVQSEFDEAPKDAPTERKPAEAKKAPAKKAAKSDEEEAKPAPKKAAAKKTSEPEEEVEEAKPAPKKAVHKKTSEPEEAVEDETDEDL